MLQGSNLSDHHNLPMTSVGYRANVCLHLPLCSREKICAVQCFNGCKCKNINSQFLSILSVFKCNTVCSSNVHRTSLIDLTDGSKQQWIKWTVTPTEAQEWVRIPVSKRGEKLRDSRVLSPSWWSHWVWWPSELWWHHGSTWSRPGSQLWRTHRIDDDDDDDGGKILWQNESILVVTIAAEGLLVHIL